LFSTLAFTPSKTRTAVGKSLTLLAALRAAWRTEGEGTRSYAKALFRLRCAGGEHVSQSIGLSCVFEVGDLCCNQAEGAAGGAVGRWIRCLGLGERILRTWSSKTSCTPSNSFSYLQKRFCQLPIHISEHCQEQLAHNAASR
jgi:hypothetical protein